MNVREVWTDEAAGIADALLWSVVVVVFIRPSVSLCVYVYVHSRARAHLICKSSKKWEKCKAYRPISVFLDIRT